MKSRTAPPLCPMYHDSRCRQCRERRENERTFRYNVPAPFAPSLRPHRFEHTVWDVPSRIQIEGMIVLDLLSSCYRLSCTSKFWFFVT